LDSQGTLRWAECVRVYTEGRIDIPYFSSSGSRNAVRSKFNARRQEAVVRQYAQGILESGVNWLGRSPAIAHKDFNLFLCFGPLGSPPQT
jgi:hypothetical protein